MNAKPMFESHQNPAPWSWPLEARRALTIEATTQPRWLRVDGGCVWATEQEGGPAGDDIWLDANQSLAVPAGSAWVIQGWPSARISLLEAAPEALSRGGAAWPRPSGAWQALLPVWQALQTVRQALRGARQPGPAA